MLPDNVALLASPAALLESHFARHEYSRVGVLLDENTQKVCYPLLESVLPSHSIILIPSGEEQKTLETCCRIWQQLTDLAFDRHSCLLIVGGGVAGDMGGFCAATFKRGIHFILMPTTLLAQADASIGGKLAIDFQHYKNHIGIFQLPDATLIATDFLQTLPERELRSGFAEVIKHCLISDPHLWKTVSAKKMADQSWGELVRHSAAFKSRIVAEDPREKGIRKILNFGHTIGHAVESYLLAKGNRIFHGEAIAVGMIAESYIAVQQNLLSPPELELITAYLLEIFGKVNLPGYEELMPIIVQDKKNKKDQILMALLEGIGKAVWDIPVSGDQIKASLEYYTDIRHN